MYNTTDICNYGEREVTNLEVLERSMVSNGVLTSTLVNHGWVSNFTITATGQLSGGVVTGYIKNDGVMRDFEFRGASIIGGTLGGTIRNISEIGGYFQNVTFLADTKIIGGIFKGTIKGDKKSPAVLEKVRVKKGSHLSGVTLGKGVVLEKGGGSREVRMDRRHGAVYTTVRQKLSFFTETEFLHGTIDTTVRQKLSFATETEFLHGTIDTTVRQKLSFWDATDVLRLIRSEAP